jgi:transcription initiation factor TFIIH subunit 1
MLKIFVAKEGEQTPESYIFNFTSPNARAEADAIKDALGTAIQAAKAGTAGPGGASSATIAVTTAGSAGMNDLWSKPRLEADAELQVSLLKSDAVLSNTFTEAVLSGAVTAAQFWSTRTHLLRAHAIERSQARGPYNVLAAIRPTTVNGVAKVSLSLSTEQIDDIFAQHPLVKKVHDENVPRVSKNEFWSRFFLSRLFKKLKGEKLLPNDPTDNIFDRYLLRDEEENSRKRRKIDHVPLTIDLAGNEQNLSKVRPPPAAG